MDICRSVAAPHLDFVHDVAFDASGRRMATCAADMRVRVLERSEESGEWSCVADLRSHMAPVWRVAWAHPEFGSLLASCSNDRNVIVWEELRAFCSHCLIACDCVIV
jgi:WD40 repeat protein